MITYITTPFRWFFKLEAASGLILLIAAIVALIWSNSDLNNYYFDLLNLHILIGAENFGLDLSIRHWINDALMAIFFFVVTLEIKREFIQGELSRPKQALLPIKFKSIVNKKINKNIKKNSLIQKNFFR